MTSIGSPSPFFLAGKKAYEVDRSLRFNDDDTAYLNRTPSSAGNRKTFTWSSWIKLSSTDDMAIFSVGTSVADRTFINTNSSRIFVFNEVGDSINLNLQTTAKLRDFSAWYHLVVAVDSTQATASNRVKIYLNNTQLTDFDTATYFAQDSNTFVNNNQVHRIGNAAWSNSNLFNGYMAEINFLDGFQYDPSYFGETDSTTGQWNPKKYTGSYGTNGFYLNFSDTSSLGADSSSNSNNFTPNNFSTSAGAGNDSVEDTPTNNFCTLNPLDKNSNVTASDGNLKAVGAAGAHYPIFSTFGMKGGKWYVEYRNNGSSSNWRHAIMNIQHDGGSLNGDSTVGNSTSAVNKVGYGLNVSNGQKMHDTDTGSSYGSALSGTSDVLQCAVDLDNGKIYWGINNTWFNSGDPAAGSNPAFSGIDTTITWTFAHHIFSIANCTVNFGQQGFYYTPPSGFKALSSANLPDPTILLPNEEFDTKLWSGNDGSQTITYDFGPDWVWLKNRGATDNHFLTDSVRGAGLELESNTTAAEVDQSSKFTGFTSTGFTLNTTDNLLNGAGNNYVGWAWNAGDTDGKTYTVTVVSDSGNKYRFDGYGTSAVTLDLAEGGTYIFDQSDASNATHPLRFYTAADKTGGEYTTGVTTAGTPGQAGAYTQIVVAASAPTLYYQCSAHPNMGGQANTNSTLGSSNFAGSIQSTVKANPTAGFSIVSYEGNDVQGATVGHGLGVAPQVIIIKNREVTYNWVVWHQNLNSAAYVLYLNDNNAQGSIAGIFNSTLPSSTVFTLGGGSQASRYLSNQPSKDFIAYVFSEVAGYSKFGSYVGNASSDGTFVFTGFRVAWLMTKRIDSSSNWAMYDNKRDPHNVIYGSLIANLNNSESTGSVRVDFVSNGFKHRNSDGGAANNISGAQYIYLAFAESPFKNARAR